MYHCQYATNRYNLAVHICNYGKKEKTKIAVKNVVFDHGINIFYRRYDSGGKTSFSMIQKEFYENHSDYDFIWFCTDCACPNFAKAFERLQQAKEKGISCILTNPFSGADSSKKEDKIVASASLELFGKHIEKLIALGGVIVSKDMAKQLSCCSFEQCNPAFWQFSALARVWAKQPLSVMICNEYLFYYNDRPPYFCATDFKTGILEFWTNEWCRTLKELPPAYTQLRKAWFKIDDSPYSPLQLMNLIYWRADGTYNMQIYRRIERNLSVVTRKSLKRMKLIALLPASLCRLCIRYQQKKPVRIIMEIYRICFTRSEM